MVEHLYGFLATNFGIYPQVGDKTQFLVVDIDDHAAEFSVETVVAQGKLIADRLALQGMNQIHFLSGISKHVAYLVAGLEDWIMENLQNGKLPSREGK